MPALQTLLRDLIAFPTVSHRSNLDLIAYVEDYLQGHGLHTHRVPDATDAKASLFARIGPPVDGGAVWSGHTDVVPVTGQAWTRDPFRLEERDGRWYGRGSCDMKGFLACCLHLVPELLRLELEKPIYLAFSYDEEVGCRAAPALIEAMLDHYDETPAFALIGEPTGMRPTFAQKGIAMMRTTVRGSEGHSSRVREEVSAVHVAARLVTWIEDHMASRLGCGPRDERFDPPYTTMHVGTIEGGQAGNVIANHCAFVWDMRTIPADRAEEVLEAFHDHAHSLEEKMKEKCPDSSIRTELFHPPVPPLDTPQDSPAAAWIANLTGAPAGEAVSFATEAGQFAAAGLPAVICGPGSIAQAHRADEYVEVEQIEKGLQLLRAIARWASADAKGRGN